MFIMVVSCMAVSPRTTSGRLCVHPVVDLHAKHADQERGTRGEEDLGLDFESQGTIHRVFPKYKPLGIKHENVTPVFANKFTVNSYAETALGICKGWKLVAINGEELAATDTITTTTAKLDAYMADFDLWPLVLEFKHELSSDRSEAFEFCERPLGILLHTRNYPVKVASIVKDSPAARSGVKASWYLTKISGQDVQQGRNYAEVIMLLGEVLGALERPAKTSATDLNTKKDLVDGQLCGTSASAGTVAQDSVVSHV